LDDSASMIEDARRRQPHYRWIIQDITRWASNPSGEMFDLVFSNAALQWVPNHASLYPQLLARVAPGGAFAVQIPCNLHSPAQVCLLSAACLWWRTANRDNAFQGRRLHPAHFPDELLKPLAEAFGTEFHAKAIKHGLYLSC